MYKQQGWSLYTVNRAEHKDTLQEILREVRKVQISTRTIRRRLNESQLASRRPKNAYFSPKGYALPGCDFLGITPTGQELGEVSLYWWDQSSIQGPKSRQCLWRSRGERNAQWFSPRLQSGSPKCLIVTDFLQLLQTLQTSTKLVQKQSPYPQPLKDTSISLLKNMFWHFLQVLDFSLLLEKAKPHSARLLVTAFFRDKNINTMLKNQL